jgi:tetratricopeptide (TPR) repeat protein
MIKENMNSEAYYIQGNEYRRQGDFPAAMNCYLQAISLDPESPAVEAEKMLEDIMNFYCKDYYNP